MLALVGFAVIRVLRTLRGTTEDRRDPSRGPVIGSVDTWAPVPRAPGDDTDATG